MPLTPTQLTAFAALLDLRTQFVQAGIAILAAGGIAAIGPGRGSQQMGRTYTSLDFARGAATGKRVQLPARYNYPGGNPRWMYSEFLGTFSILNSSPFETDEAGAVYLTEDHVRELDQRTSTELALFLDDLRPFETTLLKLDVLQFAPIEPDERPADQRECNITFNRWSVRVALRESAIPNVD